jgi:hypothetical protein
VKTPEQVQEEIRRRLSNTWHGDASGRGSSWPHQFSLGSPAKSALETDFSRYQRAALAWRDWAAARGVTLTDATRVVHGTTQQIPTHLDIPDADTAARLCGQEWTQRLKRGRARAAELNRRFPAIQDVARMTRLADRYTDADFELLCKAGEWFARNSASGLTPRQVPIPGFHAKWLNTHQSAVAALAGIPDLGLLPPHPARLHFTYLDPDYIASGHRRHDSATVGDGMTPVYLPTVIVISENKDTALHFPFVRRGISVEGMGSGGGTAASIVWLRDCPNLFYWGDIDAAGFEILNGFREAGLAVTSMLMDTATYDEYERFGTTTDVRGNVIQAGKRRALPYLTDAERRLYEDMTDPAWQRFRRIEQERIPLATAARVIQKARGGARRQS